MKFQFNYYKRFIVNRLLRLKRRQIVLYVCGIITLYLLLLIGTITDKWTPFEDHFPYDLFDSPFDSYLFSSKKSDSKYHYFKLPRDEQFIPQNSSLNECKLPPLVGSIKVWMDEPSEDDLTKLYPDLEDGGHGYPKDCYSVDRVAIIIPYRGRPSQLKILLHNLHQFLKKQQLNYGIFLIEQVNNQTFNRAKLINVGFIESQKYYDWDCFIFHDVDMIPENDRNLYKCPKNPRHMSVALDKFDYQLPYRTYFGGITALTKKQFEDINGYSNDYWGWGGEDDEALRRLNFAGYQISRYPNEIARYKMIKHEHEGSNPVNTCRFRLLKRTKRRFLIDGLSNLKYKLIEGKKTHLYTRIYVDLLENESRKRLRTERSAFTNC